jgi:hypothetical protein
MKHFLSSLCSLALLVTPLVAACSSSSTEGTSSDGGAAGSPPGAATLSCVVQLNGFAPQCQFYEATGADAARAIDQLRAGCVDQSAGKAKVVDACPTADVLGGCKTPVKVQGSTAVQLFITNFEYQTGGGAGGIHTTPEDVKSFCASQGASATYVPSP